jgi:hypothetical protein
MKITSKLAVIAAFAFLAIAVGGVTGCNKSTPEQGSSQAKQYTCSMHPEVVQDKPGKCPKCGMELVEKH